MSSHRCKYSPACGLRHVAVTLGAVGCVDGRHRSTPQPTNKATLTLSVKAKKSLARQHVRCARCAGHPPEVELRASAKSENGLRHRHGYAQPKGVLAVKVGKRS